MVMCSELTYYPVKEPGTRLLEPGYPDSVVFYFLFLKFMLIELILAACTECGRPTFSSCRVWQSLRLGVLGCLDFSSLLPGGYPRRIFIGRAVKMCHCQ